MIYNNLCQQAFIIIIIRYKYPSTENDLLHLTFFILRRESILIVTICILSHVMRCDETVAVSEGHITPLPNKSPKSSNQFDAN